MDRQFNWAGDLAGPSDLVAGDGTKGQVWIYRTTNPPLFLGVGAERIDGRSTIRFELFRSGTETPAIGFPGGGIGYTYVPTSRAAVFIESGCWRVKVDEANGVDRGLVLRVR